MLCQQQQPWMDLWMMVMRRPLLATTTNSPVLPAEEDHVTDVISQSVMAGSSFKTGCCCCCCLKTEEKKRRRQRRPKKQLAPSLDRITLIGYNPLQSVMYKNNLYTGRSRFAITMWPDVATSAVVERLTVFMETTMSGGGGVSGDEEAAAAAALPPQL